MPIIIYSLDTIQFVMLYSKEVISMQMLLCIRRGGGGEGRGKGVGEERTKNYLKMKVLCMGWFIVWFGIFITSQSKIGRLASSSMQMILRRTRSCFHYIYAYLCLVVYACARMRTYAGVCKETARKVKMTPRGHAKGVTGSERLLLWYLKIFHLLLLLFSVSNKLRTVVSHII